MKNMRIALLAVVAVIVVLGPTLALLFTDYLWFESLDLTSVFTTLLSTKVILWLIGGIVFFLILAINLRVAGKSLPQYFVGPEDEVVFFKNPALQKYARLIFYGAAGLISLGAASAFSSQAMTFLSAFNAEKFGSIDPIFGNDISFYVFSLPAVTSVFYALNGAIAFAEGARQFAPFVLRHLKVLGGLLVIVAGIGVYLFRFSLLNSNTGVVDGAGYADISATLPIMNALFVAMILAGIALLLEVLLKRSLRVPVLGGIVGLLVLASIVYPSLLQQFRVLPNELDLERPYLARSIEFTREAYDIEKVEPINFSAADTLEPADLIENESTIKNIRLWDWRPLLRTYGQIQEIRTYYQFADVDVDRYQLGDEQQQLMIAARELSVDQLEENARTWVNEHQVFLHGYGVVANKVNEVAGQGLPNLLLKDIPPKTDVPELAIERPEIYFGELSSDYGIVRSNEQEFDYPGTEGNVFTDYEGEGGVSVSPLFNRIAYALRFSAVNIVLGGVNSESKILINRNIIERARAIAPFLLYDQDPYVVISEGRIYWIIDAYTVSDQYPYSQSTSGINYIRNSVKVVIDAYNGTPTFFLSEDEDPIIQTYVNIFPDLFTPIDEMSEDLRSHTRYPVDMFNVQSEIFATYHMDDPQVFYNREDQWVFPNELLSAEEVRVEPYYVTMRLPGESTDEFALIQPFNPRNKNNLNSLLVARNDGDNYGKLMLLNFPKDRLVYGTMQMESLINQDPEISAQLSLWNQEGSRAIRGNLLVVPIEDSLLYVEPLYLEAETSELPELKRVIVGFKGRVVMEPSLDKALEMIFKEVDTTPAVAPEDLTGDVVVDVEPSGPAPSAPADSTTQDTNTGAGTLSELISQAENHYQAAVNAQRDGDWSTYGQELSQLEDVLAQMAEATGGQ